MKQKIVTVLLLLTILLVAVALNFRENPPSLESISALESAALIEGNKGNPQFKIMDVRTSEEFNMAHLRDAELLDFYSATFNEALKKLDREKSYLIYCRSGVRGEKTLRLMETLGFKKVYHMAGGFLAWQAENFPTN